MAEVQIAAWHEREQSHLYRHQGENLKHVQTQVLIAFTSFPGNRGYTESAKQATPVSAKYSKSIERKRRLLMVKATLVIISQEKCINIDVSSETKMGVLRSCLQQSEINAD